MINLYPRLPHKRYSCGCLLCFTTLLRNKVNFVLEGQGFNPLYGYAFGTAWAENCIAFRRNEGVETVFQAFTWFTSGLYANNSAIDITHYY
jgi:hypothetical protein